MQVWGSPGVWEKKQGALWCLGGEEGGGVRRNEVQGKEGQGDLFLPAQ